MRVAAKFVAVVAEFVVDYIAEVDSEFVAEFVVAVVEFKFLDFEPPWQFQSHFVFARI